MKECHKLHVTSALILGPGPTYILGAVRCGEEKVFSGGTAQSELPRRVGLHTVYTCRTPLILINWDCQPSRYAENPDNWNFLENIPHWQSEVRLLLFTVCTYVWTFRPSLIWSSRSHNTALYVIRPVMSGQVSFVEFSIDFRTMQIRITRLRKSEEFNCVLYRLNTCVLSVYIYI